MRRLTLALLFWLCLAIPASADGPPLYFPVISRAACAVGVDEMSDFKVIVPTSAPVTNKVKNPSGETTGNFAALAGTTVTRESTIQHYGLYAYRVQSNADNEGVTFDLETLSNVDHWVTMRLSGTLPAAWDWSLDNVTYTAPVLVETIDSTWKLYALEIPAAQANGATVLYVRQNGAGTGDFWLDGVQVEENVEGSYTSYCDGTQPGCEWNGAEHASSSTRSPDSRAGGSVLDLEDDYGFNVSGMSGTGTAPQELFIDSYSQLPGGELNSQKVNSRVIILNGFIDGTDMADFWAKKEALQMLFDPDAFPEDENGKQPVRIRFTGATLHKEIAVFYEGGLETTITADDPACAREKVAVRFVADDPYWYEIGESAALLDTEDTATFRLVAGRLRSTGQWDDLGPPHASGTYTSVNSIAEDATYIYFGGTFLNFNNIAAADYIVRLNKQTGVYSALGTGGPNNTVNAMAFGPDGLLYVAQDGTTPSAGSGVWDPVAETWAALGSGLNSAAETVVVSPTGLIVYGGNFTTAGGGAAVRVATWNPATSAWAALGGGTGWRCKSTHL